MNFSSFIASRIAFNRQRSFSRFIIRLSIAATFISVAVMIITLSVVNGFQQTVSGKVFSFWGHVRVAYRQPMKSILSEEEPIEKDDNLVSEIRKNPQVASVHPFATRNALLKSTGDLDGVLVKGLDASYDSTHMTPFIRQGRWLRFSDSTYSREIILSEYTAAQLNVKLNDRILIYFIQPDGRLRPNRLTVVGLYGTGIEEYDKSFAIGDMKLIQRLNEWNPGQIGGYEIFIRDYKKMDQVSNELYEIAGFPLLWDTKTIRELYPNIFDWLNIQDTNQFILITIMTIIALINLITCLIILVLERLRMIGVLKALGASNWTIQKIFLNHSAIITVTGIALGTVFALLLLWIQQKTGLVTLPEDAYYMKTAAVKIVWWQVLAVIGGTFLFSFLVLLIPSLIVRRIQPIRAIRFQ